MFGLSKKKFFLLTIAGILILCCLSQQGPRPFSRPGLVGQYHFFDSLYQRAEALADDPRITEEELDKMNQRALDGFLSLLDTLSHGTPDDSIAFFCQLKSGILQHYFYHYGEARTHYLAAIRLGEKMPPLPDSLLFKPYLYAGIIYHTMDQIDSAMWYYRMAEKIAAKYPEPLQEAERLYNTEGNIQLSTGNYGQARNYFEKAISVLRPSHPYFGELLTNYRINLATAATRMEEYAIADSIYQHIPAATIYQNEILHNQGIIRFRKGEYQAAIDRYRRVRYTNARQIRLLNDMGYAFLKLGRPDSTEAYIRLAEQENGRINGSMKNHANGLTWKLKGDLAAYQGLDSLAASCYQQAIIQFLPAFGEMDLAFNPASFSGVFSYIDVFDALTAKAEALRRLGNPAKDTTKCKAGLAAYQSAFKLVNYVERTYDSDAARLFLNRIKYAVHDAPIRMSLDLYQWTGDPTYQDEAYWFDQQNKASILALNVAANLRRMELEQAHPLLQRQASIRSAIARISLKADELPGGAEKDSAGIIIRDLEITLNRVQDSINIDPGLSRYRAQPGMPPASDWRDHLLDRHTALLSFHLSDSALVVFLIRKNSFQVFNQAIDSLFSNTLASYLTSLHQNDPSKRFDGNEASRELYRWLIQPITGSLQETNTLLLIPDDELNYLPFESLRDPDDHYLLEKFAITYQYSSSLLKASGTVSPKQNQLSLAPFASHGARVGDMDLPVLTQSGKEVSDLNGDVWLDSNATKQRFLSSAGRYGVIHLATHASVNDSLPARSYVSFYPSDPDCLLYAGEIANMRLDSTRLVILSACETGTGKLVHGEGMLSLSRAFAYAGCPNIITSLWKADDYTTAYISTRFHEYLRAGKTRAEALQKAKRDLLKDDAVDARYKTPNYWASLIYIGTYESRTSAAYAYWLLLFIPVALAIIFYTTKTRRKRRAHSS